MRYVIARIETERRDMAYRFYVTDSLWAMMNGQAVTMPFREIIDPQAPDERSVEDIKRAVFKGFRKEEK